MTTTKFFSTKRLRPAMWRDDTGSWRHEPRKRGLDGARTPISSRRRWRNTPACAHFSATCEEPKEVPRCWSRNDRVGECFSATCQCLALFNYLQKGSCHCHTHRPFAPPQRGGEFPSLIRG